MKKKLGKSTLIKIMLILSMLVLSFGLSGCGDGNDNVNKLAVGQSTQIGDWKITVNDFDITGTISSSYGKLPAKTDKLFILVDVSFENQSSETKLAGFENVIPTITTARNGLYITSDDAYQMIDDYFAFGYVSAGKTLSGIFPFELPSAASDIDFKLSVDGTEVVWVLQEGLMRGV